MFSYVNVTLIKVSFSDVLKFDVTLGAVESYKNDAG